ncbi:MAG: DNA gyrase inhibitor YacG [Nitrospirae bacterium]|nr:MAG: DNA gyrase inhibitor YacG [Nitrospirota bacterium]
MKIKCPICGELTTWQENPYRPFCSERCKLEDLGAWFLEQYRIPGAELKDDKDGDILQDSRAEDKRGD